MDAYYEFIDPTRATDSVSCYFSNSTTKDLIISKGTLLQVFQVVEFHDEDPETVIEPIDEDIIESAQLSSSTTTKKLRLLTQYKLSGLITDLKAIRTSEDPDLDYLIVSTKFAKLSIIKWDASIHAISTVSLHYYENVLENQTYEKLSTTKLIADPKSVCACVFYKDLLTFLPFNQLDDEEEEIHKEVKSFYESSFIVAAPKLDSSISNIRDIQFLNNYREPTIGIVFSSNNTWAGNLTRSKDTTSYLALSLDLAQKSSTAIINIPNLPFDVDRIVALQEPLNGCLLIGCNELFHVDNSGIARGIALNEFTKSCTDFKMADQTDLKLMLEGSAYVQFPNDSKVLMITNNGEFFLLDFVVDGKSIKSFKIKTISRENYADIIVSNPTTLSFVDSNTFFIGNGDGDNSLVGYKYKTTKTTTNENSKTSSKTKADEEDDDIYSDEEETTTNSSDSEFYFFRLDELVNIGPVTNFTMGHISTDKYKNNLFNPNYKEVSIITASGSNKSGSVCLLPPSIQPDVQSSLSFSQINRMWTLNSNGRNYLVTTDAVNMKSEIFLVEDDFKNFGSKDFSNNEVTIMIELIHSSKRIVQITSKNIFVYDLDFKKLTTIELENDVVFAYVNDPFIMLTNADGDIEIYEFQKGNKFDKIPIPQILSETIITTGYIASSSILSSDFTSKFRKSVKRTSKKKAKSSASKVGDVGSNDKDIVFLLVTGDNRIIMFEKDHNEKCFQLNHIDKLTESLELGFFEVKDTYPDPFIKQIVLNELGDLYSKDEYLTVLTVGGEVYLYKLFKDSQNNYSFLRDPNTKITGAPENAYPMGTHIERRLVYMANVNGYSSIFVSGMTPYWICKTYHSVARIFKFTRIPAVSFCSFDSKSIKNGFIYLDNAKNARICNIPLTYDYSNTLPIRKIKIGESVKSITYHETSNTYVLSTYKEIPYNCLDEDGVKLIGTDETKTPAMSYKGSLKLISPLNWSVIDEVELQDNEVCLTVKSMSLDVTSRFKKTKELIVFGTGRYRMEDLVANGSFNILEIINIIPEPGRPETNHKFKELFKEETKGAVTAVCEISGRFLVSQGQKIIIRDLQEDNTVVPVAFLDTAVFVTDAKAFGNLLLLGDSMKSIWFAGFDAEPFRMIMLGKDLQRLDVNATDFIVYDRQVYFLVADYDNVLHLLQYDPEDPKSSLGQRLIPKASFNINSLTTCLRSLPKNEEIHSQPGDVFQVIGSNIDGSFYNVFPVSESTYRRMYIIQQQIIDKESHHCGLNPRLNRFANQSTANNANLKPLLDYDVIRSFAGLSNDRKKALAMKVGSNAYQDIWKDIIEFENTLKNM